MALNKSAIRPRHSRDGAEMSDRTSAGIFSTVNKIQAKRLLNVAKACRETKTPEAFSMDRLIYSTGMCGQPCGTPACALGNYAARRDLQRTFRIDIEASVLGGQSAYVDGPYDDGEAYFGLDPSKSEWEELFGLRGCGEAKTAKQAARYIERFVARKLKQAKR